MNTPLTVKLISDHQINMLVCLRPLKKYQESNFVLGWWFINTNAELLYCLLYQKFKQNHFNIIWNALIVYGFAWNAFIDVK